MCREFRLTNLNIEQITSKHQPGTQEYNQTPRRSDDTWSGGCSQRGSLKHRLSMVIYRVFVDVRSARGTPRHRLYCGLHCIDSMSTIFYFFLFFLVTFRIYCKTHTQLDVAFQFRPLRPSHKSDDDHQGGLLGPPMADDDHQGGPPSPQGGQKELEAPRPTWGTLFAPTTPQGDDWRWDRVHSAL